MEEKTNMQGPNAGHVVGCVVRLGVATNQINHLVHLFVTTTIDI